MGGFGSGWHGGKDLTSDYQALDVRQLGRHGRLTAAQTFRWSWTRDGEIVASIQVRTEADRVVLSCRHRSGGGDWQPKEYPVRLDWTDCAFGGRRAWFRCPAVGCGRRVAILYGGAIFACRYCYRLAYESQREAAYARAARRARKINIRLGGDGAWIGDYRPRPKGMHWRTYTRLYAEAEAAEGRTWKLVADKWKLGPANLP